MARDKAESKEVKQKYTLYVAIPAVHKDHLEHLSTVKEAIQTSLEGIDYNLYVGPNNDKTLPELVECFNQVVEEALEKGYDYVWFIDADIKVPVDAFKRLLKDKADVASGVAPYHKISPVYKNLMVAGRFLSEGSLRIVNMHLLDLKGKKLRGDVFAGTNCMLVKRKVFESGLRFTYTETAGFDLLFWKNAKLRGFKLVVDGNVLCEDLD